MSKIKDFFKYIYKRFYNSDIGYLITTSVYLIICVATVVYFIPKNIPLDQAVVVAIISIALLSFLFIPIFAVITVIYAAIHSLVLEIKFRLESNKINKKDSAKSKKIH